MIGRYAFRSVRRNARRTLLSILGIGIGCALGVLVDGINRGKTDLYVRTAADSGFGHLRIVPATWKVTRDPDLRLADWRGDLAAARALPGVAAAVPRAHAQVLLAVGNHVVPVEMAGVDPGGEPRLYRFVRGLAWGRYLAPGDRDAMVVGKAVADRLDCGLGDDVLASAVGPTGEIQGAMFRIVGVIATGSEDVDASISQVTLPDLERFTGREGAGEISILLTDWRRTEAARAALAPRLHGGDQIMTWAEFSPEFEGHLRQDTAASHVITGLIILIVLLGVASAQLAAVLERRREFAVLTALGVGPLRIARLVLQEAAVLGLAGAAAGVLIGAPFVWYYAKAGMDFSHWIGKSYAFAGVIVNPVLYTDFGPWILVESLLLAVGATLLASLYPAWYAARTDPAVGLRVAQ